MIARWFEAVPQAMSDCFLFVFNSNLIVWSSKKRVLEVVFFSRGKILLSNLFCLWNNWEEFLQVFILDQKKNYIKVWQFIQNYATTKKLICDVRLRKGKPKWGNKMVFHTQTWRASWGKQANVGWWTNKSRMFTQSGLVILKER